MGHQRLRVAWFSPLNIKGHAASRGAYVSDQLLPYLSRDFEIELFCDSFEAYQGFSTHHYLTAFRRHRERPFDIFFYQLEECRCADFVRIHLGLIPGVVWFHDFVLRSDGPEQILSSPWQETVMKYIEPKRAWPERGREYQPKRPLAFREAGYAAVALFSNPASHAQYLGSIKLFLQEETNRKRPPSFYLPYPVSFPEMTNSVGHTRWVNSADGSMLLVFCGGVGLEDRAHKLLEALSQLQNFRFIWLLDRAERFQAQEMINEFNTPHVEIIEGRTPAQWQALLSEAQVAVHTNFSVFGRTGPYLEMSLAAGLPCLVTDKVRDFAAADYLPDQLVFKIQAGAQECAELREVLRALINGQVSVPQDQIRAFAYEHFETRSIAAQLAGVFRREAEYLRRVLKRWGQIEGEALISLFGEARGLAHAGSTQEVNVWQRIYQPVFEELGWYAAAGRSCV